MDFFSRKKPQITKKAEPTQMPKINEPVVKLVEVPKEVPKEVPAATATTPILGSYDFWCKLDKILVFSRL